MTEQKLAQLFTAIAPYFQNDAHLARQTGVDRSTVSRYKRGESNIPREWLEKLLQLYPTLKPDINKYLSFE